MSSVTLCTCSLLFGSSSSMHIACMISGIELSKLIHTASESPIKMLFLKYVSGGNTVLWCVMTEQLTSKC